MSHLNVRTWMTPSPLTIGPEETVIAAYEKMKVNHVRRLPVLKEGDLIGMITINDVRSLASPRPEALGFNEALAVKSVSEIMSSPAVTITQDASLGDAARLMMNHKISGLPVVEEGRLVGVISESDLFRLVIAESWAPKTVSGPGPEGDETLMLSDQQVIHIRPIRPDDAVRLQASFSQMSQTTIYDRFMGYKKALLDPEARYLTSLDYDHHMALVATEGEEIVGVARYHISEHEPDAAEFAIVINDAYQRLGLGTHLMKRLIEYAQARGISTLLGFAHEGNIRLLRFVQRSGLPVDRKYRNGLWEIRLNLKDPSFSLADVDPGKATS